LNVFLLYNYIHILQLRHQSSTCKCAVDHRCKSPVYIQTRKSWRNKYNTHLISSIPRNFF